MKKALKIIVYCLILLPVLLTIISQLNKNSRCITYDNFLKTSLDGVVVNKYIDSSQHSYPTLEIKNLKNLELNKLNLVLDTTSFYDDVSVSDTIYKELNNDSVFRFKNGIKCFILKIDFGCKR